MRGLRPPQDEPEEEQQPQTVRHLVGLGGMSVEEFLDQSKAKYPFYGVLLPRPAESQLNAYIRSNWDQLHAMSGSACLLVTALAPEHFSETAQKFLTNLVGEEQASRAMQHPATPEQATSDVYKLAQETHIDYDKLPCLVLMSDLGSNQQLLQRLPADWDADSQRRLFEALFTKINHSTGETDPQERLAALQNDLGNNFMLAQHSSRAARGFREGLANIKWGEVLEGIVKNRELILGALKLTLTLFGASSG